MPPIPSLFVSHGAPNLVLHDSEAKRFLQGFAREIPRPRAIVVASAHDEADVPTLTVDPAPATVHDFRGFEPELRRIAYPAPGEPDLAARAAGLLEAAGLRARTVSGRGFDHGTWTPLVLLYPEAEIPVVQLSVQPAEGPAHHLAVGEALRPLRDEGVLLVGSGAMTHNLDAFFRGGYGPGSAVPGWVEAFGGWARERIEAGDREGLAGYRTGAPFGAENHPTEEHLLPLFVAMGAGSGAGRRVHASAQHGVLLMDAYRFD